MKKEQKTDTIIAIMAFITLFNCFLVWENNAYKKEFDYEPYPSLEQEKHNNKHPTIDVIPAYFDNCSNIKVKRYVLKNGCVIYGELDGRGRAFTFHSYKECPNCRKQLKKDILEITKLNKIKNLSSK